MFENVTFKNGLAEKAKWDVPQNNGQVWKGPPISPITGKPSSVYGHTCRSRGLPDFAYYEQTPFGVQMVASPREIRNAEIQAAKSQAAGQPQARTMAAKSQAFVQKASVPKSPQQQAIEKALTEALAPLQHSLNQLARALG